MEVKLHKASRLRGEIIPPPDKSISHRAIMLCSLSDGHCVVRNFLRAADTMSTLNAFRTLGVDIEDGDEIKIKGRGLRGLKEPSKIIDCGNSGTTMRLISGILSGNPFLSVLSGDDSLNSRPMSRVINPLRLMGANIMARKGDEFPPIALRGGQLRTISYEMPVASAQVKSAILLAGLYADGWTEVIEQVQSRDHTERMLPSFGAIIESNGLRIRVKGDNKLVPYDINVPNDFSSAAFFIAAASIIGGSEITIRSVGLNPTRTGFLEAAKKMGASIEVFNETQVSGEPVADLSCRHSALRAIELDHDDIPSLIDEFPILCIMAALADGTTVIKGASELRVKESDRITAMNEGLHLMGVQTEELEDGIVIYGKSYLKGARINSHVDHRIAMAFSIAAMAAEGETIIDNAAAVDISFPGFFTMLRKIAK